ncbi:hypothetical protein PENSPDRAFT_740154, partial [Peniophora sp. CONT]
MLGSWATNVTTNICTVLQKVAVSDCSPSPCCAAVVGMRMWSGCVGRCYLDWPPASPRWWSVGTASHRQRNLGLDTHLGTVQYLAMDTTDPSFDRQPTPEPVEDDEEPERPPFFGSPAHGGAGNPELRRRLSQLSSPTPAPLAKRTRTMDLSTFARDQANKVRLPGDLQKRSVEYAQ